jgi:proteasome activator subunit 4
MFLDLMSRIARDQLTSGQIPFSPYGVFTKAQSDLIFTAILRLLEIPVGQATSPYSTFVDEHIGLGSLLMRDAKKHPIAHHIARWVIMSLSPDCMNESDSILEILKD